MIELTKNICSPYNYLNKSTLLIDCQPDFLLSNIYYSIEWFIQNLYVISSNTAFLQITDRLLSAEQFEEIHRDIRKTLLLNPRNNCCVIVQLDDLDLISNKYFTDMLLNRDNNITLICFSSQPTLNPSYSGNFTNILIRLSKKTDNEDLLKSYFNQHFSDRYEDFTARLEYVSDAYLLKICCKDLVYVENKTDKDISFTIKKCPIQENEVENPVVRELKNKVADLLDELDILTKTIKRLEIK